MSDRPCQTVAVVMRREPLSGEAARWQTWRWVLADVVLHAELGLSPQDTEARPIEDAQLNAVAQGGVQHWLFPGFEVTLHRDDTEGYYLNLTTDTPGVWVMWRPDETGSDDALPSPQVVTLSYTDAGRWLDAQERVDQVPAPAALAVWLREFVQVHHQPEPKRRKRPQSFRSLTDRFGNPVSISTDKPRGGPQHGG